MQLPLTDSSRRSLDVAENPQPPRTQAQSPMVYVYEKQTWEYQVVVRNAADQQALSEDELNALGAQGWELTGVVSLAGGVYFYFKRARA